MGICSSKLIEPSSIPPVEEKPLVQAKAAGCVFTNGSLILAGYQPNKKYPSISGIGGTKKKGETPHVTAIRETVEELFHIKKVPAQLIDDIKEVIKPQKIVWNGEYCMFLYSFQDLETIMLICKEAGIMSPLYDRQPLTIIDLLLHRIKNPKAEISHLCFLPLVSVPYINRGFVEDIKLFLN